MIPQYSYQVLDPPQAGNPDEEQIGDTFVRSVREIFETATGRLFGP